MPAPAQPPVWVSYWFALSTVVVIWDACYCFFRPRSLVGGDLAWIWAPYNMVPYGLVDYLYGQHALDANDGFTNAQALLNIVESAGNVAFLALQHAAVFRRYRPVAPLVGFAVAVMTTSKTVLYFLQEYFCGWCMVGHNDARTFWLVWVVPNGTWIVVPFVVSVVLGTQLARTLLRASGIEVTRAVQPLAKAAASIAQSARAAATAAAADDAEERHAAALPLTFHPHGLPVLVVGSNRLAQSRTQTFLASNAAVILSAPSLASLPDELQKRVASGQVRHIPFTGTTASAWRSHMEEHDVALVCVTDTLIGAAHRSAESAAAIADAAGALRVPVNVADQPLLSTYTFPSVHRFAGADGVPSSLQVAVSTDGRGCRLAGRIRRDIVAKLPATVGAAVDNVGRLRARAKARARARVALSDDDTATPLNSPVPQLTPMRGDTPVQAHEREREQGFPFDDDDQQLRRMRWVHQMSEYYSYEHLARLGPDEMDAALETFDAGAGTGGSSGLRQHARGPSDPASVNASAAPSGKKGRILLVGSGPGDPGLLTVAALHALRTATVVLSDKLVPSAIISLIPASTTLHVARKFPGNAEGAQSEMMDLALAAAADGHVVVRLKQGDPFVYGRGGEEVLFFRRHGYECALVPGVSSALAGPLMAGIPVTQRGVAESLVICTGVGRGGKKVQLPGYVRSRSVAILMGVARIGAVVDVLTSAHAARGDEGQGGSGSEVGGAGEAEGEGEGRDGAAYPPHLPIAVIERGSSDDQRVVLSTLADIAAALESVEQRPPGMMLVGWAAMCLEGAGTVDVLDTPEADEHRLVGAWLGGERWKVREGLSDEWRALMEGVDV
ncbi:uroporphyrin-III C-methyltransferase [Cryptotrichosporon argae]